MAAVTQARTQAPTAARTSARTGERAVPGTVPHARPRLRVVPGGTPGDPGRAPGCPPAVARRAVTAATARRRRFAVALVAVGLVVAAGRVGGGLGGSPLGAPERRPPDPGAVHVVEPGDTLWSIAQRAVGDGDPRPVVDELVARRGAEPLVVGEAIPLPG